MRDTLQIYRKGNVVVRIFHDRDPLHPRKDFDNVGTMACWSKGYSLGDESHDIELNPTEYRTPEEFMEAVREQHPEIAAMLPIYLYDHGSTAMSTSSRNFEAMDGMGWDWGWIGIIYATAEDLAHEHLCVTEALNAFVSEVKEYGDYLNGSVYAYEKMEMAPTTEQLATHGVTSIDELDEVSLDRLFDECIERSEKYEVCGGYYGGWDGILDEFGLFESDRVT